MHSSNNVESEIKKSVEASIAAKQRLLETPDLLATVGRAVEVLIQAFKAGNKAFLFANGGNAADAQHIASELVGRFAFDRAPLPALALSVNTSCVTAIGNDYGFDLVFSRQIEALTLRGMLRLASRLAGPHEV